MTHHWIRQVWVVGVLFAALVTMRCASLEQVSEKTWVSTENWTAADVPGDSLSVLLPPMLQITGALYADTATFAQLASSRDHLYRFGFARAHLSEPASAGYYRGVHDINRSDRQWREVINGIEVHVQLYQIRDRHVGFATFVIRSKERSIWLVGRSDSTQLMFLGLIRSMEPRLRCSSSRRESANLHTALRVNGSGQILFACARTEE